MNKKYVIIALLLATTQLSYGITGRIVYLNNKTSSPVDFYIHSSLAGCCEGCGGTGKCKVSLAAGKSGQFNMKDRHTVCAKVCIQCITARIQKDGKTLEATFNLAAQSTIDALKAIGSGTVTGAGAGAGGIFLGPEALVVGAGVGAAAGAIAGAIAGGVEAEQYQCTDMEITLSEDGNGYRYNYQKR